MAVTLQFQTTGAVPGDGRPVAMRGGSITLGRGNENDLVLPDPDKTISKRHCAIEDQDGGVVVIDLSTNGTFLNYDPAPLGRVPTPLNDGDILTMGPYELLVSIPAHAAADLPPLEEERSATGDAGAAQGLDDLLDGPGAGPVGGDDFLDDLLGGGTGAVGGGRGGLAGPAGVSRPQLGDDGLLPPLGVDEAEDLLDPLPAPEDASFDAHAPATTDQFAPARTVARNDPGPAIPEDWDDLLEPPADRTTERVDPAAAIDTDGGADGAASPAPGGDPFADQNADPFVAPAPSAAASIPAVSATPAAEPAAAATAGRDDDAARAFLRAAMGADLDVPPGEMVATLSRMGHVMRVLIHGVREILMTRTSIKSEFRIEQTRIGVGGNNPLKFSVSPEQAVEAMIRPSTRGYMDATDAARQAMEDIKAHEVAMMTGMEAALKGVLACLAPSALEGQIQVSGGMGSLLKGKKARYWEVYEQMYAEISDQAGQDFHELFAREFARAYRDQLERLK